MLNSAAAPERTITISLRNFSAQIFHFHKLGSTSTFLKEYAQEQSARGAPLAGIGALADEQTAGRGRLGRSWHSPPGEGFYFSLLLEPKLKADETPLITLMAAIATAEAIQSFYHRPLDIKWPNDILINKRKICGILTEGSFAGAQLNYVVVGIGVNLAQRYFPDDLNRRATSLLLETGSTITPEQFLHALLARIDQWYSVLATSAAGIIERWQHLSTFAHGKRIVVNDKGTMVTASTCGLEPNGALRARTEDGRIITLYGGEINTADEEE